jgi:hypothetical protein
MIFFFKTLFLLLLKVKSLGTKIRHYTVLSYFYKSYRPVILKAETSPRVNVDEIDT